MKSFVKIFAVILLLGFSIKTQGQYYGYHYSGYHTTGYHHNGVKYVPYKVQRTVRKFHGYKWIGTRQIIGGHGRLIVVTLQRENRFLELTFNRHGKVIGKRKYILDYRRSYRPYWRGYDQKKIIYYHDG